MAKSLKKGSITLKDIAEKTGYSVNTVSHALNDKDDISTKTKEKIKKVASEIGYIGNAMASSLRTGNTKTIAVILGDISNPHFSIIIKEAGKRLMTFGYTLVIFNTDENKAIERQAIVTALSKKVDGIIICPSPGGGDNIKLLKKNRIPYVLIGRRVSSDDSYVICDDENGGYIATKYLLAEGHRNILFLNGPKSVSSAKERLSGYKRAINEAGKVFNPNYVIEIPIIIGLEKTGIRQTNLDKALSLVPECSAILAFSDMIAWEIIYCLQNRNINVPADVSVVGFDNIQSRYPFPVELTTVSSSKTTMSQVAVDILVDQIENSGFQKHVVLETELIVRDTTLNAISS